MQFLMPSIVDPTVELGGGWTATRGFLDLLRREPLRAEVRVVAPYGVSSAGHRLRQGAAIAQSLVAKVPAKILFSRSRHNVAELKGLLRTNDFDAVIFNGADMLWLISDVPAHIPKILIAHNLEHELFAAQINATTLGALLKGWLRRDCARLRQYELSGMHDVRNVIFLSAADAVYARTHCPGLHTLVVPPVFTNNPAPRPKPSGGSNALDIGMVANFDWWPNSQAIRWFMASVFPHLNPRIRLHLFGHRSGTATPGHPRIEKHGFVVALDEVWSVCDLMMCPIRSGSGVCIKLAEAVACGMPVLATHFAVRGLELEANPALVLLDKAEDWVMFLNSNRAEELGRQSSPPHIMRRFRPETHAGAVADFVRSAIDATTGPPSQHNDNAR